MTDHACPRARMQKRISSSSTLSSRTRWTCLLARVVGCCCHIAFISLQKIHYMFLFSLKNGSNPCLPRRACAHAPPSYSDDELRRPYAVDEDVPHGDGDKLETKVQQSGSRPRQPTSVLCLRASAFFSARRFATNRKRFLCDGKKKRGFVMGKQTCCVFGD